MLLILFFFQAEDGIRDLVRSRGLGDVYKRQNLTFTPDSIAGVVQRIEAANEHFKQRYPGDVTSPVSYTHLTLPTSDLV